MTSIQKVIHKYASELRRIYDKDSAGDYTFEGLLGEFLREAAPAIPPADAHVFDPIGRICSCGTLCGIVCDDLTYEEHLIQVAQSSDPEISVSASEWRVRVGERVVGLVTIDTDDYRAYTTTGHISTHPRAIGPFTTFSEAVTAILRKDAQ